jgi:hypothetical protein
MGHSESLYACNRLLCNDVKKMMGKLRWTKSNTGSLVVRRSLAGQTDDFDYDAMWQGCQTVCFQLGLHRALYLWLFRACVLC